MTDFQIISVIVMVVSLVVAAVSLGNDLRKK